MGQITRVGSLDYHGAEGIRQYSLDQQVNRRLNSKNFEFIDERSQLLSKLKGVSGTLSEVVMELSEEFIHPVSQKIKIGTKSSLWFRSLVELINEFPESEDEDSEELG